MLTVTLISIAFHAYAQQDHTPDTLKKVDLSEVTISGKGNNPDPNAKTITSKDLELYQAATLGETLSHMAGVQNSYFGPNSGAPVIRSLSGNRVRTLSNGVALSELSGISPSLNVSTDMANLLGIDVYKSSASILYGGKAIGGAVNLKDNSIPASRFSKQLTGSVTAEGSTNNGYKQGFDLNGNMAKHWAWHFGAMNRWNGNIRIPGNTKAPIAYDPKIDDLTQTMAQVRVDKETIRNLSLYPYISQFVLDNMGNPAWDLTEADLYTFQSTSTIDGAIVQNPKNDKYIPGQDPNTPLSTTVVKGIYDYAPVKRGVMPNSHAHSIATNAGATYIRDKFYAGIGYRASYSYYGIPGFAWYESGYQPINIRSQSNSILLESGTSSLQFNYLFQLTNDEELSGSYESNRFNTNRHVARLEWKQKPIKLLKGTSGIDLSAVNMSGRGAQRYLPDNKSQDYGAFSLQHITIANQIHADLGYRHDIALRRAIPGNGYKPSRGLAGGKLSPRNFHLNHFNTALQWDLFNIAYVKASYVHAERAPDINELYAGNDHYTIMIEENGDDKLHKERSKTTEFGAGIDYRGLHFLVNRYHTIFNNYMYLAHTGISRSGGFLVKEWRQSDTKITGWEAELGYKSTFGKYCNWELSSFFDLVKNSNVSNDPLRQWAEGDYMPNMPASRYNITGKINYQKIEMNVLFDRYLEQQYLGKNINPEPPMPAYSMLGARVTYRRKTTSYYLSGNNLLNVEARPQNSYLKYLAPLPGINIALGIKVFI
ncbi:TonB-dependent receptor [Chitinophaga sancti]|uniref:TonB-dependent receptor n=1 Tax=Chitinophaga sancti TaxID=1004 RepID=UPI003F7A3D92